MGEKILGKNKTAKVSHLKYLLPSEKESLINQADFDSKERLSVFIFLKTVGRRHCLRNGISYLLLGSLSRFSFI